MTNAIYTENYCKINNRILPTNGKVKDVASSANTKTIVSYLGATPQHDSFYDNASGKVGMIQVPVIMTPEIKNRLLNEFTSNGQAPFAILNIETNNYDGSGHIVNFESLTLENGAEVTLEFIKLNPKNK